MIGSPASAIGRVWFFWFHRVVAELGILLGGAVSTSDWHDYERTHTITKSHVLITATPYEHDSERVSGLDARHISPTLAAGRTCPIPAMVGIEGRPHGVIRHTDSAPKF